MPISTSEVVDSYVMVVYNVGIERYIKMIATRRAIDKFLQKCAALSLDQFVEGPAPVLRDGEWKSETGYFYDMRDPYQIRLSSLGDRSFEIEHAGMSTIRGNWKLEFVDRHAGKRLEFGRPQRSALYIYGESPEDLVDKFHDLGHFSSERSEIRELLERGVQFK